MINVTQLYFPDQPVSEITGRQILLTKPLSIPEIGKLKRSLRI